MTGTGRRRRRRTAPAAIAAAALAVGAATAAATGWGLPDGESSAQAGSDVPPETAKVTRQTLVDTQPEGGALDYGDTTAVAARLGGTLTALPASGAVVRRGEALYWVDNAPVLLLYGTLPAYRPLAPGTEGADVKQFEQNLYDLGYRGFTVDDTYSASTATAVKKWQDALGLPETGTVELGRVTYATGEVRIDSLEAATGDASRQGEALLSYTGTSRVVSVELGMSDQRLARTGAVVTIKLPAGKPATGKIAKTETVVKPADGQNPATTKIAVTITLDDQKAVDGLAESTVEVGFTASQRENVLTVPVAALLALAEGGYGVEVVDGAGTRIIAVQTGLFAGGRVEVSGDGLTEGMTVGMPA